jgi:acyl-CoA synthetase (AMP-forming)/AMP-acid ligase II
MHGYWQNDEETARVLKDGWLLTGDIGHIDEDGHIVITDRKKDIIVNDKGDNVAPQRVEGMLTLQPEILQAMVHGDRRPYLVGLVVPDPEWAGEWAEAHGRANDLAALRADPEFHKAVAAAVDRVNAQLSVIENDITEALAYLDSCQTCSSDYAPTECGACDHQGHQKGEAPPLFAGLSRRHDEKEFDVPVTVLTRDALTPREGNN